jgi:hypothetical protein
MTRERTKIAGMPAANNAFAIRTPAFGTTVDANAARSAPPRSPSAVGKATVEAKLMVGAAATMFP